jgi:hypothetical protein
MANDDSVKVEIKQRLYFNNVQTIAYDVTADGNAYMTENVLVPSFLSKNIVDMAMSTTDIGIFASLLVTSGLDKALRNQPGASMTVFARKCGCCFAFDFSKPM